MGFSLGKVFKPIKKGFQSLARSSRQGFQTFTKLAAPFTGAWAPAVIKAGDMVAPGDSPERNAQKRADFEYARSLADQRAFQDDSVQRRVADAKAAGIHPLAALGYQAPSFNPPQTSGYYPEEDMAYELGQDISRAVAAGQTQRERNASAATAATYDAVQLRGAELQNENLRLDLEYKRLRYMQLLRTGNKPAFPDINAVRSVGVQELGQGDWKEPGSVPAVAYIKNSDGTLTIAPSSQAKPLIEDMFPLEAEWYWKNRIVPVVNPYMEKGLRYLEGHYGYGQADTSKVPVTIPFPSRIPRRVRGSRVNPAYYKNGWYN
ncbi:MAG: DNA pilot protein [Microviridae sp.]|nr:MAG: DNA pilot protein [Microviridae sp.]